MSFTRDKQTYLHRKKEDEEKEEEEKFLVIQSYIKTNNLKCHIDQKCFALPGLLAKTFIKFIFYLEENFFTVL